jgi:glycosyltransferase involved in cell wall biosynthesis
MYETDNIETVGWVDVTGTAFRDIARRCVATIYPSCSEGGGGSVITCMHAGLIPVVTEEASVDVDDFGTVLPTASAGAIREAAREIAGTDADTLERRARAAWTFARERHTRERFAAEYEKFVSETVLPALERRGSGAK